MVGAGAGHDQAALDDSTLGALEKSAALDDLALQTAETTAKQLAAQGVDIASVTGQQQYLQALKDTAAGLQGPMRDAILEYIALLEGVPTQKTTRFTLTAGGGGDFAPTISGKRAAGGPVSAGGAYLVGEKGPEILQMGSSGGNVIREQQARRWWRHVHHQRGHEP
jgi:hypothetical protein